MQAWLRELDAAIAGRRRRLTGRGARFVQITELRLLGFKSFVDPARAPVEQGLTGVVGPNGCGKSNLLEACAG